MKSYRNEVDPNPDNWEQRYNGEWNIILKVHQQLEKEGKNSRAEETRRLQEGEDEVRSAESYHSEESAAIRYTRYVNTKDA